MASYGRLPCDTRAIHHGVPHGVEHADPERGQGGIRPAGLAAAHASVAISIDFSRAARSQRPSSAAASYVLWKKLSSTSSGSSAVRTVVYGSRNSRKPRSK